MFIVSLLAANSEDQTGWRQNHVQHMWDLSLAPACLLFKLYRFEKCS